jgi:hypothetical protein
MWLIRDKIRMTASLGSPSAVPNTTSSCTFHRFPEFRHFLILISIFRSYSKAKLFVEIFEFGFQAYESDR